MAEQRLVTGDMPAHFTGKILRLWSCELLHKRSGPNAERHLSKLGIARMSMDRLGNPLIQSNPLDGLDLSLLLLLFHWLSQPP